MKYIIVLVLLNILPLFAQIKINIPDTFTVQINDKIFKPEKSWYDSLQREAEQSKIYYQIAGCLTNKLYTITKLRVPQTLSLNQVIHQVIFYYSLLNDEDERSKETVLIYPFFSKIDDVESLKCTYDNKNFYIHKNNWETIQLKSPPTPEEKFIYNEILKLGINQNSIFAEISENALQEVSKLQNMSYDEILKVYKKVNLWNATN